MEKTKLDNLLIKLQFLAIVIAMVFLIGDHFGLFSMSFGIEAAVIVLFLIFFIISLYLDIRYKEYTTSTYIILADGVQLVALILMCYFGYRKIDVADQDALWDQQRYMSYCRFAFLLALLTSNILRSEKYKLNKTDES